MAQKHRLPKNYGLLMNVMDNFSCEKYCAFCNKSFKKHLIYLCILFVANSCTVYKKVQLPKHNGITGYHGNDSIKLSQIKQQNLNRLKVYNDEKPYIKDSNELNWGLSLSGGGIRSATYNMGALKALYDSNMLDSIQIISSVSGGGYLSYWLYTNFYKHKNTDKEFGYYSFNNHIFLKNICDQQGKSNFLPNDEALGAFFDEPTGSFNTYRKGIERAYGHDTPSNLQINGINHYIKKGSAPYFIINTTIASKEHEDWLSSIFEFTPIYQGNPELGFDKWNANNSIDWSKAISISGAALKFKLLHKIPNYSNKISTEYIALSDGGHSENLGAIALIRRGVKNIIIVDAEHNDNYSFDAYIKLKKRLKAELNLNLNIDGIDRFIEDEMEVLENSVFKGSVNSIPLNSEPLNINIYYVKMSMSEDINEILEPDGIEVNGKLLNEKLISSSCTRFNKKKICKKFDAEQLKDYETMNLEDLSKYWVKSYANHINNHPVWSRIGYTFPHTTTSDQTYYRDQLVAFVGLGYLQASELKKILHN